MKKNTMSRTMHRFLHVPCIFLVLIVSFFANTLITIYDFLQIHKDTINWYSTRIIRDIKCIIPKVVSAIVVIIVTLPPALILMIWMIQLI